MQTFRPSNFEELLDYSLKVFNGWEEVKKVELSDNFNYRVIIRGEGWDGQFDQRVSQIVLGVHAAVIAAHAQAEGISYRSASLRFKKDIRVIATVNDGSLDLLVKIAGAIEKAFDKMDGKQALIGVAMISASVLGYVGISGGFKTLQQRNEHLHQQVLADKSIEERKELLKTSNTAILEAYKLAKHDLQASQKASDAILSVISENDTVSFPVVSKTYSKKEIKENLEIPASEPIKAYYVDDEYLIREWKHYDELTGVIEVNGERLKDVEVLLNEGEKEQLAKLVNTLGKVALQVTVEIQDEKVKGTKIIGIGAKRETAVPLSSLLK